MSKQSTSEVQIQTKSGLYRIPHVDERNHLFDPVLSQNPCLQVVNEDMAVLSVLWSDVDVITVFRPTDMLGLRQGFIIYERAPAEEGPITSTV